MRRQKMIVTIITFIMMLSVVQPVFAAKSYDMTRLQITEVKPVEQKVIRSVSEPITYHAVYLESELIGYLYDFDFYLALLEHVYQTSYHDNFPDLTIDVANGMRVVEEQSFFKFENKDEEIINVIYSANRFSVEAYKIMFENGEIVYVEDVALFEETLNAYVQKILGDDFDMKMSNEVAKPSDLEIRNRGFQMAGIEEVSRGFAPVDRLLKTSEDIDNFLTYGYGANEQYYITQRGDTLESIARANNINPVYLRFTNPTIFTEGNLIPEGSRVNLTPPDTPIDLRVERYNRTQEVIYAETIEEIDPNKFVDQVEVVQEPVNGLREVLYLETVENGITTESSEIESRVVQEPVNKHVIKGSKPRPTGSSSSVGTFVSGSVNHGLNGFAWPTYSTQITSFYGWRAIFGDFHTGIDIVDPNNRFAPVLASKSGVVVNVSSSASGYGNLIVIRHDDGWYTRYAHLSSFNVVTGQHVNQGDWIGNIGSTGWSTGPHLHFEITSSANQAGTSIDPCLILGC